MFGKKIKSLVFVFLSLVFCSALIADDSGTDAGPGESFTIVALPDTQYYSESKPEIFMAQTKWIKENKEKYNIVYVAHEGDITNKSTDKEWERASEAMAVLEGVVPYGIPPGNHDGNEYNSVFTPERFKKYPWYGGNYQVSNRNSYQLFEALGLKFVVICLDYGAQDKVLEWAGQIVDKHKDRRAILVTHAYMYDDDTRMGPGDKWNPNGSGREDRNDGEEMWEKLVSKHENFFLVLSGHVLDRGLGLLTSEGKKGNMVHQILANYQMTSRGQLRLHRFVPKDNMIYVSTYSPVTDKWFKSRENKFKLEYKMSK